MIDIRQSDSHHLDPFGFFPAMRSSIGGLHDGEEADSTYVFHTEYVEAGEGPLKFELRFAELQATHGTLVLRVNALKSNGTASSIHTEAINLDALAKTRGQTVSLRLLAEPDTQYAALGHIYVANDATARGLDVELSRMTDQAEHVKRLFEARQRIFTNHAASPVASLISDEPAMLATPVSQMCTAAQFLEPVYQHWCERMGTQVQHHRKQWEFVYILQALHYYGMLQPGAIGLGFGVGTEPIPAVLASFGCKVLATDLPAEDSRAADWAATNQHVAAIDALLRPEICDSQIVRERCEFQPVDMNRIPMNLMDFDFTWSSCAYEHLGSIANGLKFVEESINCLRPGGIAVHTTELNLSSNDDTVDNEGTVLFRKRDFESLALKLISKGHTVAQIKFDQGERPLDNYIDVAPYSNNQHLKLKLGRYITTSFGIVVRRKFEE
ncbi:MAG: methyltransferase domain-containing protein [Proteobacteria bacterium]|nr:methyltransferase domain-containing protein [Pseudomonadota bacterium]